MRRRVSFAFVAPLIAVCGCDALDVDCTSDFRYGVSIEVRDASSGAPITEGLAGSLTDGDHSEDMEAWEHQLFGAGEREGRYTAVVTAPGYLPWQQAGIRVRADECHVIPVTFDVNLTPV